MKDITRAKIPGVFRKKYTQKKFESKLLKRIYIPHDKEFIESLFSTEEDGTKGGTLRVFDRGQLTEAASYKKLVRIGKDIKKQKSRLRPVSIFAALALAAGIFLLVFLLRNYIVKNALVSAMQGIFGAKCEIEYLDFDILHTRFRIKKLAVADRKAPMKNLFEIGEIDMYFNLLELTRKKFVAENMAITGISWNTDRKTSGLLPPKKNKQWEDAQKNKKPNPVLEAINAEIKKIRSGVSVGSGIAAVQDQLNPVKFFEAQKAAFKTPALVSKINEALPEKIQHWQNSMEDAKSQAASIQALGNDIASINPNAITTLAALQDTLEKVKKASDTIRSTKTLAEKFSTDIQADANFVKQTAKEVETAVQSDSRHVQEAVDSVKGLSTGGAQKILSGLFDVFVINTLGTYYPYFAKGMNMLRNSQSGAAIEKKPTLKDKAMALKRLHGRDYIFNRQLPSLVLRNIALSAHDPTNTFSGGGQIRNITNDVDKLGLPITIDLNAKQAKLEENVRGVIDLRSKAENVVDVDAAVKGIGLSIPSDRAGMPSVSGTAVTEGRVTVSKKNDLHIQGGFVVQSAKLTVAAFEPAWLHEMYARVMSDIHTIDLSILLSVIDAKVDLDISSELDAIVTQALQKEFRLQLGKFKKEAMDYASKWFRAQRAAFEPQIARFNDVASSVKKFTGDVKDVETLIKTKQQQLEQAISDFAKKQAGEQAGNLIKKLF